MRKVGFILILFCLSQLVFNLSTLSPEITGEGFFEVIVLDPGHGGYDPGAVVAGVKEKDVLRANSRARYSGSD